MNTAHKIEAVACAIAAALLALLMSPVVMAQTFEARVPPPQCWPSQVGGSGSKAVRVTSDYGQALMWWCGQERVGIVSAWAYTMNIPDKLPASLTEALKLMWEANVSNESIDPTERTLLSQDAAIALEPFRPVAPRWLVAPNSTSTTRPVYNYTERTIADGSKQIVLDPSTLRATVGQACDCAALKHVPGSVTYCQIPAAALTPATAIPSVPKPVAVCRLQ